jgi:hypothetical protein
LSRFHLPRIGKTKLRIALGIGLLAFVTSCVQLMGLSDNYELDADAGSGEDGGPTPDMDGTVPGKDGTVSDAKTDATSLDGGEGGITALYVDWADAGAWTVYESPPMMGGAYVGGTFDGKYVYFTPVDHTSKIVRYDTTLPFTTATSWSAFDAPGMLGTQGFFGATFDGVYVYFAGGNSASGTPNVSVRFNTKNAAGFTNIASWEKFDTTQLTDAGMDSGVDAAADAGDASAEGGAVVYDQGFAGMFYDGVRFVYLVPNGTSDGGPQGVVTRFDVDGGFPDASAWTTFDLGSMVDPTLVGFAGGYFDGQYVTLIPQHGTKAARYDTKLPFKDAGSWSSYQVATDAGQYLGVGADGTNVYASPHVATSPVQRHLESGSFADASTWTAMPLTSTTGQYQGMAFDGRFLYVVPYSQTTVMQRLDTQGDSGTWSALDLTKVGVDAGGTTSVWLSGGVFDGQFIYFPTWGAGQPGVVRLETQVIRQAPAKLLANGSFL